MFKILKVVVWIIHIYSPKKDKNLVWEWSHLSQKFVIHRCFEWFKIYWKLSLQVSIHFLMTFISFLIIKDGVTLKQLCFWGCFISYLSGISLEIQKILMQASQWPFNVVQIRLHTLHSVGARILGKNFSCSKILS